MEIVFIPQLAIGEVKRKRVGDFLNQFIADNDYHQFRFAVAYMRVSGLDRLAPSIESLINRGGHVSGAVGIDDAITSFEALKALLVFSDNSTIFYTTSGFIYHPKVYLISGQQTAIALVGSANMTRDGLFRNVEAATAVLLNLEDSTDYQVYQGYNSFIDELLNYNNPNVQLIDSNLLQKLYELGVIKRESETREPGPSIKSGKRRKSSVQTVDLISTLFPSISVPTAPPGAGILSKVTFKARKYTSRTTLTVPPPTLNTISTFIMQLSEFDSSHRTGVPGTAEILIPLGAKDFFPELSLQGRKHPDANFDVVLNTPEGRERHDYRVWFYKGRDEFRLRMNKETVDLSTKSGGDLIVMNRLPVGSDPEYEVTILPQTDPTYPAFLAKCDQEAQGKKWGIVSD